MNREIKFKYIYSDGKSFIVKVFTLDEITNGDPFEVLSDNPMLKNFRCIARLQYTGLLDKGKNEIYEGDIYLDGYNEMRRVVYRNGSFTGEALRNYTSKYLRFGSYARQLRVIGNIHQNPNY